MEFNEEAVKQLLQAVDDFTTAWQKMEDTAGDYLQAAFNLFANSYCASEPPETLCKPAGLENYYNDTPRGD